MYIYLSPVLGEHSEDFYDEFIAIRSQDYATFIRSMRSVLKYGVLRSGVLVVETEFKDVKVSGTDVYNYLINFGFSESASVNITRLFSVNNRLIEHLVDEGFDLNDVVYGMDLKARLKSLGLVSATVTKSYALEDVFVVHKLLEVYIEEEIPPPPPEVLYRSQATFTYSTRKQSTKVELRIWYQSYDQIEERELIDKWNEANENAVNLTNEPLLDSLEPVGGDIQPGFELNHEIYVSEVEGSIDTWYGKLIISRSGKSYVYDVL